MRRYGIAVALLLLLGAVLVDGWDWWRSHDVEVLGYLRGVPGIGQSVDSMVGTDATRSELRIAVDASYPPFASVAPTGELVGFEVEFAAELGRRLAEKVRIVNMDAGDSLFDALAADKIDAVVAGLSYYPDVTRDVAFSRGYYEAGPVVLARGDDPMVASLEDLAGRRVAVEAGSSGEQEARGLVKRLPGMQMVSMLDVHQVVSALAAGDVQAAVIDRPSLPVDAPEVASLRYVAGPLRSLPYVVAVRRKDAGLLLAINRELEGMRATGVLKAMEQRWFP